MVMSVTIRQANPQDADAIYNMINGLSVYREGPQDAVPDVEEIRTSLFSTDTTAEAYVCEIDGNMA